MSLTLTLMLMGLVLMGAAVYGAARSERYREEFTQELRDLIQEAALVKQDMEALLQNASLLADDMIKELDNRIDWIKSMSEKGSFLEDAKIEKTKTRKASKKKNKNLPYKVEELRRAHPYIIVPRLYKEGYSIQEIAEILDRGQGEVKLILDLKKRREALG